MPFRFFTIAHHGRVCCYAEQISTGDEAPESQELRQLILQQHGCGHGEPFEYVVIDNGFVAALKAGKVTVVPEIECFDGAGVHLLDGQYIEPDVVIAATGYCTGLQTILGHTDVLDDLGMPKIHGDEQMEAYPGLWFIGPQPRLRRFNMAVITEMGSMIARSTLPNWTILGSIQ